jgi:hypothetical protein
MSEQVVAYIDLSGGRLTYGGKVCVEWRESLCRYECRY